MNPRACEERAEESTRLTLFFEISLAAFNLGCNFFFRMTRNVAMTPIFLISMPSEMSTSLC